MYRASAHLIRQVLPLAVVWLFSVSAAQAGLVVPAGDGLVVNDTDLNISWTQDANLFKTIYTSNPNLVSQIAGVTPTYSDSKWGEQTIDADDFNTSSGTMSWWGAIAWVNYLNSISYGGVTGWRLPTSDTCRDYNCSGSELGHLYYTELNKVAYPAANFGILGTGTFNDTSGSVGPFSNVHTNYYWSGTEQASAHAYAWFFNASDGGQDGAFKVVQFYGWAVRPGQVAAVPVPAAVWLMGSALAGLMGLGLKKAGTLAIG